MSGTLTTTTTVTNTSDGTGTDGMSQVVLYNDNVNTLEHVVLTLCSTFGHSMRMAVKIAMDAHMSGRSVAEVEDQKDAITHKGQLVSGGLTAEVEKI